MSELPRLDDDQLKAEFERRSHALNLSRDWSRNNLLPAVTSAIDTRPQAVTTSRLSALAGVAGLAAILIVFAVALPRLGPGGPTPSPGLLAAPPSTISSMPVREFASRVAAGELRGETVIVNAEIVAARGGIGETEPCPPPGPCLIGVLVTGVGVSPGVFAHYVANIDEGDPSRWSLSFLPSAPQTGVMVLSVDQEGRIIFVGRNPPEEMVWVLSEIAYVDFDAMPLEEINVVSAWLTGIVAPISCAPPEPGTYIADLPGRYCGNPSWLAPNPLRVDPNGYTMPDDALQVQSNAYLDFAPSPAAANGSAEPRAGLYVIAKRLEGSGCPDGPPPCWQWEIIGRVTISEDGTQAQPFATPTLAAVREIACTPQGSEDAPTLVDEIGIVDSCQVFETRLVEPFPNPISVRNPDGDDHVLEVHWSGNPCDIATRFTLWLVAQRVHLDGVRPDAACDEPLVTHHMRVVLTEPLLAETVTALLSSADAPPPPTPTTAARFECVGPPLPPGSTPPAGPIPAVIDETGLIESCLQTDFITELTGTISVSNPFENKAIEVVWADGICDGAIEFTFRAANKGYELAGERPTECAIGGGSLPIYIRFTRPIAAHDVRASLDGISGPPPPTSDPPPLVCGYDGAGDPPRPPIVIVDHTWNVQSCVASSREAPTMAIDAQAGERPELLEIVWQTPCSWMPATVEIWGRERPSTPLHGLLIIADLSPPLPPDGCRTAISGQAVELTLVSPRLAWEVDSYLTSSGNGIDWEENDSGTFRLELEAGAAEYAVGEPIDISASLVYTGASETLDVTGNFNVAPAFGFEQLDGDLLMYPGPYLAICPPSQELQSDEAVTRSYEFPTEWHPDDHNANFYEQWVHDDGMFGLPAGTYRIFASSRFSLGDTCGPTLVALKTSVVIHVR